MFILGHDTGYWVSRVPQVLSSTGVCMSENEPKTPKPLQMKEIRSFETTVRAEPVRQ
jgi:hypothetical protein